MKLCCENIFCIYQNNKCILDDIHLDIQGNCLDCIYINIDCELLDKLKEEAEK